MRPWNMPQLPAEECHSCLRPPCLAANLSDPQPQQAQQLSVAHQGHSSPAGAERRGACAGPASQASLLAVGGKDAHVSVWATSGADARCLAHVHGHMAGVTALAFSRSSRAAFLVSGGADKLLKVGSGQPHCTLQSVCG